MELWDAVLGSIKWQNHFLTSSKHLSISPALMTIGPLTAYSTAFTWGFSVSIVSVFSRIFPSRRPAATLASAVLKRIWPYFSTDGPWDLCLTPVRDVSVKGVHWSRAPAINDRAANNCKRYMSAEWGGPFKSVKQGCEWRDGTVKDSVTVVRTASKDN